MDQIYNNLNYAQNKTKDLLQSARKKSYEYTTTLYTIITNYTPTLKNGWQSTIDYIYEQINDNEHVEEIELVDIIPFLCAMK